eukprot:CAMPEP_0117419062 /NCGR_PEP_ID=MMETSP0758-20121206/714_1 /TAXON_ID=63605 /ORGANISM="Percolomonas cosmopolitus, Strain AE-1 (ATCC 50343)" /LENGTH=766 /DNA_ID=CAMNT_0005199931 /DNA_START=342 /DNA_END=2642 /DNA_ORIENTATION=+
MPKCIIITTEQRIIFLAYTDLNNESWIEAQELKYYQLESKTITCFEMLSSHPIIAIGCSDGTIRFYNYAKREVEEVMKINKAHSKKVTHLKVVHGEDAINDYPTLLSAGDDGTIACWDLISKEEEKEETKGATWSIDKSVLETPVQAWLIDQNMLYVLTHDKTVRLISLQNGTVKHKQKVPFSKVPTGMLLAHCHGRQPSYFLFSTYKASRIASVDLDLNLFSEQIDLKKTFEHYKGKIKLYDCVRHPLADYIIFCGTNNGLIISRLGPPNKSAVVMGQHGGDESITHRGRKTTVYTEETTLHHPIPAIYYIYKGAIMRQVAHEGMNGSKVFSKPNQVLVLPEKDEFEIGMSPSGRYVSLFNKTQKYVNIYLATSLGNTVNDFDKNDPLEFESPKNFIIDIAWCNTADRFALLTNHDSKNLYMYKIQKEEHKISTVRSDEYTPTISNEIEAIYGGHLLGISYKTNSHIEDDEDEDPFTFTDTNSFHFINWGGNVAKGGLLPKPLDVVWDPLTLHCLMIFKDSYAIFTYTPEFKMHSYVKQSIEDAYWWNGTLFIVSADEIKAIFVADEASGLNEVYLATYDLSKLVESKNDNPTSTTSYDPTPVPRPKGSLTIAGIVGDQLFLMDRKGCLYDISLQHPCLKMRLLLAGGAIQPALSWLSYISLENHAALADFCVERGLAQHVVRDTRFKCPTEKILEVAIKYNYAGEAFAILKQLEETMDPQITAQLYSRIAKIADENDMTILVEQCINHAASFDQQKYESCAFEN